MHQPDGLSKKGEEAKVNHFFKFDFKETLKFMENFRIAQYQNQVGMNNLGVNPVAEPTSRTAVLYLRISWKGMPLPRLNLFSSITIVL